MNILPKLFQPKTDPQADMYRWLLHEEAKIGGRLFGAIPAGHRREFFCLDKHTWIWHEEWTDKTGKRQVVTTRYDVRPNGVLKAQGNRPYQPLTFEEALNLYEAVELYEKQVDRFYEQLEARA